MLTATVTKKSVRYVQEKLHNIAFNLILNDDTKIPQEVINRDFSCEYRQGDNPAQKVADILDEINRVISRYKAEQQIFNSAALNNAVNSIQAGVVL